MKIAGAIFGFLALAAVFVLWFRAYRSIKGDGDSLFQSESGLSKKGNASLEQFIASYKRGEVTLDSPAPVLSKPAVPGAPALQPAAAPAPAVPTKRESFISGPMKLAYLSCKAGLRDHHVFAHVQLQSLSTGGAVDPALARIAVDLVICNAAMSPIAAIDMMDANAGPPNAAKAEYLKALGIRYLRLSPKSLPKPEDLHALIYKM